MMEWNGWQRNIGLGIKGGDEMRAITLLLGLGLLDLLAKHWQIDLPITEHAKFFTVMLIILFAMDVGSVFK